MTWGAIGGAAVGMLHAGQEHGMQPAGPNKSVIREIRTTDTHRKAYNCAGCGAPLFGVINENCQYCKRPGGQP